MPTVNRSTRRMLSRMSSSRCTGFSEGTRAFGFNRAAQSNFSYRFYHDVDRAADNILKSMRQCVETAEIREAVSRGFLSLAGSRHRRRSPAPFLPTRDRAEDRQADHASLLQFRLMGSQTRDDRVSQHPRILSGFAVIIQHVEHYAGAIGGGACRRTRGAGCAAAITARERCPPPVNSYRPAPCGPRLCRRAASQAHRTGTFP